MSDTDFGGIDFALGTVRGFRHWKIDAKGELSPMSYSHVGEWTGGENLAVCHGTPPESKREDEEWEDYYKRKTVWKLNHNLADCKHGFYAYFDGSQDMYNSTPSVVGVVEGYGEVVIGTKGFRAMKARIIALALTPHESVWRLEQFVIDRLQANYPGIPVYQSALAMRAEYPCPNEYLQLESS